MGGSSRDIFHLFHAFLLRNYWKRAKQTFPFFYININKIKKNYFY